jgi:hypothetical protein
MRKVCAVVSLFVIVAAFALIGVRPVGTTSAGAATLSAQNGDVNGDGKIDIADGIYLLSWLFTGGPEPVACADSPDLAAQVGALTVAVQNLSQSIQESRPHPAAAAPTDSWTTAMER